MKLSATIITLNEERNIERCIRSLQPVVDEIIVLDSFSTDRTEEICRDLGVRFEQRKWEGYAQTKNYLNQLALNEMILSIDADEALDEELQNEVKNLQKSENTVYSMNRMTNYCGTWIKHSGWYPDIKVRIFPKETCYWTGEYVHEELHIPEHFKTIQLKGHLQHYSYYDFKDHRSRADKYSELTAKKMFAAGKKAGVLKPYLSGLARFFSMYLLKSGFLDGKMGYKIASISAASNVYKYKELRRLQQEK